MKAAAVQMISGPEVAPNLVAAAALVAQAADAGATLVALPEYFPLIGASDTERLAAREADATSADGGAGGPIQEFLAATAARHGIWLIGGSIPLHAKDPARLRNTCLVYGPDGSRQARYDKIHLFGFRKGDESYDEAATIEAGDTPVAFDAPCGRVGLGICYDLRFPELFRALGDISLLVLPAAFTETTGRAHWEILLRARAIENQCYLLAAAQGGRHPGGRLTHGNSMLIAPWGEIIDRLDKGEGIVIGDIDPQRLADARSSLPALRHRKL